MNLGCCYFPPGRHYLPSQRDQPLDRYQIILLGDRGTGTDNQKEGSITPHTPETQKTNQEKCLS